MHFGIKDYCYHIQPFTGNFIVVTDDNVEENERHDFIGKKQVTACGLERKL